MTRGLTKAMASPSPAFSVLGAGSVVTARHLPALRAVGGRAASIFDPSEDAARAAASEFGIPHIAASAEAAIADDDVQAVLVASPNVFHREQVECALEHGRHVLCEKPVALSLADAAVMAEAAKSAGLVLQVGFHQRFSAEHLCTKQLIEEGVLGDVRAYSGVVSEPIDVIPGGTRNYRFDAGEGGGLTLVDLGQHRIDQIRDLLGDFASVSCEMSSVLESHGMDDSVVLSVTMASGALGSLSWNRFSRAFTSPLMLYGTKATLGCSAMITAPFQSAPVSLYVEGDPATVLSPEMIAWTRPSRWWGDIEPGWVDLWPPRRNTFEGQFLAFFASVANGSPPRAGADDGYKALEVVQAAYRSHRERKSVRLPVPANSHCAPPFWQTSQG